MLIGIFFSSLGVSFSMKSNLGTTPVGICPAVFSEPLKITTGTAMGILLIILLIVQIIILKKEFPPFQVLQLASAFVYSFSVDLATYIISVFPNEALWQKVTYCTLGIVFLSFGVFIMVRTNFLMLPQDAVINVISKKYNREYGKVKIVFDIILTVIAIVGSLVLYGRFVHIGLGTIAAAVFVGIIIGKLKEFKGLNRLLDWAIGEVRKENHYGSSENNILTTSKNEYGAEYKTSENRAF